MRLTKKQFERLEPFFYRKSARQRIILFLVATGVRVPELVNFTEADLAEVDLPEDLDYCRDEIMDYAQDDRYFVYPQSKELRESPRKDIVEYLLTQGFSVDELQVTPMTKIGTFDVPDELIYYRDQLADVAIKKRVFVYPCGKPLVHSDFYRLIRDTSEKILGKKLSQDKYCAYIKTGKIASIA